MDLRGWIGARGAVVAVSICLLVSSSLVLSIFIGCLIAFLLGVLSILYLQHSEVKEFLYKQECPTTTTKTPEPAGRDSLLKLFVAIRLSHKHVCLAKPNVDPLTEHPLMAPLQQQPQEQKTSVQSKTMKLFSQSGLESLFKKTSFKVGGGQTEDSVDRIKVHGERKGVTKKTAAADEKRKFTGQPQLDYLLGTIIDYILRDFLHSWFCAVSEDKEFVDVRTKHSIEETVGNVCLRIKSTSWQPLITTTLVDHLATHTRLYRLAQQAVKQPANVPAVQSNRLSPFRKIAPTNSSNSSDGGSLRRHHRRNKSDTDLNWHLGQVNQKSVANSRFYTTEIKEECLFDPELKLLHAFFDHNDKFRAECLDEAQLERFLTSVSETILYFSLPEEDFACLPLRTFLATLLANVVFKPLLDMLSDPDFLNLQVARLMAKETPPAEFFIKMVRQCTDLSELRACRQIITKEMEMKAKEPNQVQILGSLKFTQKLIDNRIAQQSYKSGQSTRQEKVTLKDMPILTLEEILNKQLALSYYLDYLSQLHLQKYVLFYIEAREWKQELHMDLNLVAVGQLKISRDKLLQEYRDRAQLLYDSYFMVGCRNQLSLDGGLVEVLNIRLKDHMLPPDASWFESISKFIYEKIKTEEIFLHNFYQSSLYQNLLLELELGEEEMMAQDLMGPDSLLSTTTDGSSSDNNSGDIPFEIFEATPRKRLALNDKELIRLGCDVANQPFLTASPPSAGGGSGRHNRSHSDCSGIVTLGSFAESENYANPQSRTVRKSQENIIQSISGDATAVHRKAPLVPAEPTRPLMPIIEELSARIINTAINPSGQFAVYAIEVIVMAAKGGQVLRQWHVYRRYSKFLELKKMLEKRYPNAPALPFPPKKAFQNTQRAVLEHRMAILNDFLREICQRMRSNSDLKGIVKEFLEADPDHQVSGGNVTRTLEIIVNPFKSGMTKIKNMPDSLVGGLSRLLSGGRDTMKHRHGSYLMETPPGQMDGAEYPALRSMLNLMDEVFDLQTRSQWLRRGIVNRVLGAPWVSSSANKKILLAAKGLVEEEKIEMLLSNILSTIWPDGMKAEGQQKREDNTKLRTRMAAKVSLFALLGDDLGHLVGSETTRWGLLNMFTMWQNKTLNLRLTLIILEEALKLLYGVDSLTQHVGTIGSAPSG